MKLKKEVLTRFFFLLFNDSIIYILNCHVIVCENIGAAKSVQWSLTAQCSSPQPRIELGSGSMRELPVPRAWPVVITWYSSFTVVIFGLKIE